MTFSQLSWLLLVVQLVLLAGTIFVGPLFLKPCWPAFLLYTFAAGILWSAYAVCAMIFDSKTAHDVPGIGYLVIGLAGWVIGCIIYLFRIRRARRSPLLRRTQD